MAALIPRLPYSKVPAFLNVVDIAGLVKGAHSGQGLGNAFLSHINACDGIFHMTRKLCFLLFSPELEPIPAAFGQENIANVLCNLNSV